MHHNPLAAVAVLLLVTASSAGQDERTAPFLQPGRAVRAEVKIGPEPSVAFRIRVPNDAVLFEVRLANAPADLDLYLRHGAPIEDLELDADHAAATEISNEVVRVTRWGDPPLQPGIYHVSVTCPLQRPPLIGKHRARAVPFEITFEVVPARVQAVLKPGTAIKAETARVNGHVCQFSVEVPQGAACLRLDLADVEGNLDLFVRRDKVLLDPSQADHVADGLQGREFLVIDAQSDPPLQPGTYHVGVVDPYGIERGVPFTLHASLTPEPPAALLAIPELPAGKTPLEQALFATVELIGPAGGGSGSIVTPDGMILTNHHVVEGVDGKPVAADELIVAVTLDPRRPPTELFRARVVEADRPLDLALVQVTAGLYRQALPAGYRFRPMPLGDAEALKIGDSLWVAGFPEIGGTASRPSVTVTRGIVAGFEWQRNGTLVKTDAQLHAGTSGGAALNDRFELVGVPSETMEEINGSGVGQLGYVRPLSLVPPAWRKLIDERRNKK